MRLNLVSLELSMSTTEISAADPHPRKKLELLDTSMSYADTGAGDPIVFLHGNPTSSYLWRNMIPHLAPLARCVAPDLIGMGASGTSATGDLSLRRSLAPSRRVFRRLNLKRNGHAGRARLGQSRSAFIGRARHPRGRQGNRVHGSDRAAAQWSEWSQPAVRNFKALRSPAGDDMILKNNIFVERILPGSVMRKLSDEEMNVYRKPFTRAGRVAAPDAYMAARNSDRRRARRRQSRSPTAIRSGSRRARCRSCSSTPTPARF